MARTWKQYDSGLSMTSSTVLDIPPRRTGWLEKLSIVTVGAIFAIIIMGGVVRVTSSGLGCPDWPLCHGNLVPPLEKAALIEYSHRMLVSITGVLVLGTAALAWRQRRNDLWVVAPASLALVLLLVQSGIGAGAVLGELPPLVIAVHLGLALLFLASMLLVALSASLASVFRRLEAVSNGTAAAGGASRLNAFTVLALISLGTVYAQMVLGAYVGASGSGLACPDIPLCHGQLAPPSGWPFAVHWAHRLIAMVATVLIMATSATAWRTQRHRPWLPWLSSVAVGLVLLQVLLGVLSVWQKIPPALVVMHLGNATLLWLTLVTMVVLTWRDPQQAPATAVGTRPLARVVQDYVNLTKPRIIVLLLIVTLATMFVAAQGLPSASTALFTLIGGALGAGAANAINCYFDRDIDALMARTRGRPIPSRRVQPRQALIFGIVLAVVSMVMFALLINLLAALLSLGALLYYILVYTLLLKRLTPQNIVIGGAAGAVPALVGWAAVTGRLEPAALLLFAIVFYWTPPHFWALSILMSRDYERAKVPMLPLVMGMKEAKRQIVLYSILLIAITLLFMPVNNMGVFYLMATVLLGGLFIALAVRLARGQSPLLARNLFSYSIVYLALLFAAMVVDKAVIGGGSA